jgi:glycosyltransferase involved in cell wall biosynthesis
MSLLRDISTRYQIDLIYFKFKNETYLPVNSNIKVVKACSMRPLNRVIHFLQLPFFHPIFSSRFSFSILRMMRKMIRENTYDLVYFDFSQVFIYNYFLDHPRKYLMAHDILVQKYEREGSQLIRHWVSTCERRLLSGAHIQTFSVKDQTIVKQLYKLDAEVVHFYISSQILELDVSSLQQENCFCFFAAWHRPENSEGLRWFIQHVLPRTENVKYLIIGINLPEDILKSISENSKIQYTGFVDNPYTLIATSRALIAPLFKGAGIKVKVVESLCCGTPVLGTGIALEGIPDIAGNMIRCENDIEFASAILSFDLATERKVAFRNLFLRFYNDVQKTLL